MTSREKRFYLQIQRNAEDRLLYPATVLSSTSGAYTVMLSPGAEELPVEAGLEVFVYYYVRHQFMQRAGRIQEITEEHSDEGPAVTVRIDVVGEPYLAENRECYRVSAMNSSIMIEVGDGDMCPLVDVSVKGLTFVSLATYPVGSELFVSLAHEEKVYCGKGCIQSARMLDDGRVRYGLESPDGSVSPGSLSEGLQVISMAIQREHLSHLARAK